MNNQCEESGNELVSQVMSDLFHAAMYTGIDVLRKALEAIHASMGCVESSLWTINHNSTHDGELDFVSSSVFCRIDNTNFEFTKHESFVHRLEGTLFDAVINQSEDSSTYYVFKKDKDNCFSLHTSQDFVEYAKLKELVIIPIKNEEGEIAALLEMSYSGHKIEDGDLKCLSEVIPPFFKSAYEKYLPARKHRLMDSLIRAHGSNKNEKAEVLFNKFRKIIGVFCPSQGASFFMWDNHQNRYKLIATSGLESDGQEEVFYYMGEGITGWMGMHPKPFITDNIQNEHVGNHYGKYREVMEDSATKAMYIPIISPSSKDNVVGVFRLINKKNVIHKGTIDYFNDIDADLMEYASQYLALVIDRFQREDEHTAFISKLAHEFKTPANSIFKSADRLRDNINDDSFMKRYLLPYLNNIVDFSLLQRWQANTTLYLDRNRKNCYSNRKCSLFDILMKSRDVVRPMARDYNLRFNNIVIMPFGSIYLNIDEEAFVIVFHNLLTNAIKYHDPQNPDSFYVSISCIERDESIQIILQDFGIGIDSKEVDNIFEVGYRGGNAIRDNATGFGVGLPIVKQIINDYGGTIVVKNCKNPTRFLITLPNKLKV